MPSYPSSTSAARAARMFSAALLVTTSALAWAQAPTAAERAAFKRPDSIPFPADNPYTPAKAALGKMLFFETRLSRDKNLNCASCHNPSFGWQVPFAQAIGAGGKPLGRRAPTALNQAWGHQFFWDGRAASLEDQAKGPIQAPAEMDLPLTTAVQRLKEVEGYRRAFDKAFAKEGLTETTIVKAIATYERTIVTGDTPFDRWMRGDEKALPDTARRGFALFTGKARCVACHSGWNFTDDKFHDIGLPTEDRGRAIVTGNSADAFAFKTPGLREIASRSPYMHMGQIATLEAVIAHYIGGGVPRPSRSDLMQPVPLSGQDISDLAAFLRSLSSPQTTQSLPNLPAL